ncbi:6082_t:CDS:2 [Funneliformis mosseae]|uniref:6082_t:CDS:1 n=1 Tax=Funneliformis mosseae TaxID=27381 RepID=A0A9N9E2M2_FUNMO|nr:6082_t:CDS:2 [Funneliformis mosseae]
MLSVDAYLKNFNTFIKTVGEISEMSFSQLFIEMNPGMLRNLEIQNLEKSKPRNSKSRKVQNLEFQNLEIQNPECICLNQKASLVINGKFLKENSGFFTIRYFGFRDFGRHPINPFNGLSVIPKVAQKKFVLDINSIMEMWTLNG